jgi:hypothetical protein
MEQLKRICQILHLDPRYLLGLDKFEQFTLSDLKLMNDAKSFITKYRDKI